MGDDRKADYEMAPTSDPENPETIAEKVDLQLQDDDDQQWSGLGKEELLRVADTPAWNWTRNILLILFWVAWVLMLVIAIILVVKAPGCPDLEWYEKSAMYQVHVRSFKDGGDDGFGDLKGLQNQVARIKEDFGAETILLSPIFKQAASISKEAANFGYNIVDFKDIDTNLGTLDDFDALIEAVQVNGMHIVLEFVPNHTSDLHEWFIKSQNSTDQYRDFYIWAPGTDAGGPPNNWKNYKGEDAWTILGDEYYYHFYEPSQPDLNFKNSNVTAMIKEAMTFWLQEKKVDGFLIADADRLVEGPISTSLGRQRRQSMNDTTDGVTEMPGDTTITMEMSEQPRTPADSQPEPSSTDSQPDTDADSKGDFVQYSIVGGGSLPEDVAVVLQDLYSVLDESSYLGKFRVFIPQHSGDLKQNALFHKKEWRGFPSCLAFSNKIGDMTNSYNIIDPIEDMLMSKQKAKKDDLWNSWMLGHAGISRVATRAGDSARALTMLLYTLPGTPMPFYGDELGLTDISGDNGPLVPYPWDGSENGGFSDTNTTTEPWQMTANDLANVNAEAQNEADGSFLKYVKSLAEFHAKPSILAGAYNITSASGNFLTFTRSFPEWPIYLVAINLDDVKHDFLALEVGMTGTVVISASGKHVGTSQNLEMLKIDAHDAYLIELAV